MAETVIFLHIFKTAGTTLNYQILNNVYRRNERLYLHGILSLEDCRRDVLLLSAEQRAGIKLVSGHFPFGMHEAFSQKCRYFTLLRDPLRRIHSHFHFLRDTELGHVYLQNHGRAAEEVRGIGLEEFIREGSFPTVDNGQTRMLAGVGDEVPYGQMHQGHVDTAIANMERDMAVVGVTERFDETLLQLQSTFGWKRVLYRRINENAAKPDVSDLTTREVDALRSVNALDMQLYRYAQDRLAKDIARDGRFAQRLRRFQFMNRRLYAPYSQCRSRVGHLVRMVTGHNL